MRLFQLLLMLDDQITPERCKMHFAYSDGNDNPLDVYLAGGFDEWQSWQTKANFDREFVVSLIYLPQKGQWLLAGAYQCMGRTGQKPSYHYNLVRRPRLEELSGRLVISYGKSFRQPYPYGETVSEELEVLEMRRDQYSIAAFPGYSWATLSKQHLDIIVKEQVESWRSALGAVKGVYVIADRKTGKLYIGSATGDGGIWGRWSDYSHTGHGGNTELRRLLQHEGNAYAENFRFGILEIADSHASKEDVLRREGYWKDMLLTRTFGYNSN